MTLNEANFVSLYVIYCCHSLNKCVKYFVFPAKYVYILQVLEAKAFFLLIPTQGKDAYKFDQKSKMFLIDWRPLNENYKKNTKQEEQWRQNSIGKRVVA